MSASRILAYCRAGFEKECAQEIAAAASAAAVDGFVKARPESGFAVFQPHDEARGRTFAAELAFNGVAVGKTSPQVIPGPGTWTTARRVVQIQK